jgi:outer membrane immunogenic protein
LRDLAFRAAAISTIEAIARMAMISRTAAVLASLSIATAATASDLSSPVYKGSPAAPAYDWSGFYAGIHAGYGWGDIKDTFQPNAGNAGNYAPSAGAAFETSLAAPAFGGHLGYNYQVGRSLIGLEAMFTWTGADKELAGVFSGTASAASYRFAMDWLLAVTPRFGFAWDHWLAYAKAGVAVAQIDARYYSPTAAAGAREFTETATHVGPVFGAGIEYAFAPNWIFGIEYNYYALGDQRYGRAMVGDLGGTTYVDSTINLSYQTVLARLSYKPDGVRSAYASARSVGSPSAHVSHMWSGPYAGVHAGGGRAQADYTFGPGSGYFGPASGGAFTDKPDGWLAGLQLGYNQQIGSLVLGLEAATSVARLKSLSHARAFPTNLVSADYETRADWIGAITPRIGFAADRWHLYAKGGAAAAHLSSFLRSESDGMGCPCNYTFGEKAYYVGWTVGGGIEYALTPNWIFGVDYSYYDLGSAKYGGLASPTSAAYSVDLTASALVARISYNLAPPPAP